MTDHANQLPARADGKGHFSEMRREADDTLRGSLKAKWRTIKVFNA
jgi:hypothetical protein